MTDAELDGWADAVMSLPPQPALRFLYLFHKYEPEQWAAYQADYTRAYSKRTQEQRQ